MAPNKEKTDETPKMYFSENSVQLPDFQWNKATLNREMWENQEMILEKRTEQFKFNELVLAKLEDQAQILDSIQSKLDMMEENLNAKPLKTIIQTPVIQEKSEQTVCPPSKFVVRNIFKDVSKMKDKVYSRSTSEEYFGVSWKLGIARNNKNMEFYLYCEISGVNRSYSIDTDYVLKIIDSKGRVFSKETKYCYEKPVGWGWDDFIKWDDMVKDYLINDQLVVEAHVNIIKMTGIYKDDLRCFDESTRDCSDVELIVQDRKFYSSKLYLAAHSSFFKTMFLGRFDESKMSQITLTGIDAYDFQNYLEVLYGEYAIDEFTVEGLLLLGDMYDTEIVIRRCEEFLYKHSTKTLKKKLQLAVRYHLDRLKDKCILRIQTAEDIRAAIPPEIQDLDKIVLAGLLQKSLSLK